MTDVEIVELLGGVTAVARMLGIKPPSVHNWLTDGIPEGRLRELAGQIELRSNGRFLRRERWPDKYDFYWPELGKAQSQPAQPATEKIAEVIVEATAEIKQAVETLRQKSKPWDGKERRGDHRAGASAGQGA